MYDRCNLKRRTESTNQSSEEPKVYIGRLSRILSGVMVRTKIVMALLHKMMRHKYRHKIWELTKVRNGRVFIKYSYTSLSRQCCLGWSSCWSSQETPVFLWDCSISESNSWDRFLRSWYRDAATLQALCHQIMYCVIQWQETIWSTFVHCLDWRGRGGVVLFYLECS